MIVILAVVAALTAAPATSPPDSGLRLSRQEAIDEALAHNPQVSAAREQVAQAKARVTEAVAFPDPFLAATLEEQRTLLQPRTATSKDIGVGLTLPFPDKFHLRGEVARGDLHAAEFALVSLRQQVATSTAQAYDALLVALRHHEDLANGRQLAEDFLRKTEARFQAGTAPRLDTIKARVDLAQAVNDLIANERAIATSRAALNRLLGRALGASLEPADVLQVPAPLPDLDALLTLAHRSRPEIQSIEAQRKAARSATTLARQYWLPDLGITLSRNFTQGDPAAYSTAFSLGFPIFFWQHEKGEVAEARHRQAELDADLADQVAQVDLDVRSAFAAASTTRRQAVTIRDDLLPEAQEAYRIASVSYGLGGSSALDLLDAKRTLLDAESQYADALAAAEDARASLELAVGAPLPAPSSSGVNREP
jgi:outer membrane protein, heavy metal efflux system